MFFGGAVTAALLTDRAAPDIRPTGDVDVILGARSLAEEAKLDEELRARRFRHDIRAGAPISRRIVGDHLVDVVYVGRCADRWTEPAFDHAVQLDMGNGVVVRHVSAPYFMAMKIEAFGDRGGGDYRFSHDIADIVQVIDCRPELSDELAATEPDVVEYVSAWFSQMLSDANFVDAISYHLPPDAASQARAPLIAERMRAMANNETS